MKIALVALLCLTLAGCSKSDSPASQASRDQQAVQDMLKQVKASRERHKNDKYPFPGMPAEALNLQQGLSEADITACPADFRAEYRNAMVIVAQMAKDADKNIVNDDVKQQFRTEIANWRPVAAKYGAATEFDTAFSNLYK